MGSPSSSAVFFLYRWFRPDPQTHNLPLSALREGAGPGVRVTPRARCPSAGPGPGELPGNCLLPPPAGASLPWAGSPPHPAVPRREREVAESPRAARGGQDLLPTLENDNQGHLCGGDGFFFLPPYLKWLCAGWLDTKPWAFCSRSSVCRALLGPERCPRRGCGCCASAGARGGCSSSRVRRVPVLGTVSVLPGQTLPCSLAVGVQNASGGVRFVERSRGSQPTAVPYRW